MKKIPRLLCLVFAVLLLLGASGCKAKVNTSPEFTFGTDAWRGYYSWDKSLMTESEDSYYYIDSQTTYIHVIDKETMYDTVLCAKPNCLHDRRTITTQDQAHECIAYTTINPYGGIFFYEDALYLMEEYISATDFHPVLVQLSLDGTSRKVIWEFDNFDVATTSGYVSRYLLHRGVLYFIFNADSGSGKADQLYAYDMDAKEYTLLCESDRPMIELRMVGNALYIRQDVVDRPSESDLLCYDIATKTTSILPKAADVLDVNGKKFLYYLTCDPETREVGQTFTLQEFDGSEEKVLDFEVDDYYKYPQTDGTYIFMTESPITKDRTVKVYDLETQELIARLPIPENMQKDYELMCSLDRKLFLYSRFGREEKGIALCYGEIDKISTGEFEWKPIERIEVEINF